MSIIRAYTYLRQVRKNIPTTFDLVDVPNVCSPWYYISEVRSANEEFPFIEVDVPPYVQNVDDTSKSVSCLYIESRQDSRVRLFSKRLINDPRDADKTVKAYVKEFLGVMTIDEDTTLDEGMHA